MLQPYHNRCRCEIAADHPRQPNSCKWRRPSTRAQRADRSRNAERDRVSCAIHIVVSSFFKSVRTCESATMFELDEIFDIFLGTDGEFAKSENIL
uniref:Uncharacterized protein n=1 Tax=Steinernema glaseri TaxID=37863 RepID=A0A1I8A9F2_9BILA